MLSEKLWWQIFGGKKVRICVIMFLAMNQALSARLSTTPNNPTQADLTETRSQLLKEFADVFDNMKLKPMAGPLMDIMHETETNGRPTDGIHAQS